MVVLDDDASVQIPTDANNDAAPDDLSFLKDKPAEPPLMPVDGKCADLKRQDGSCCYLYRVEHACTKADEDYAEEQRRSWVASLSSGRHEHGAPPGDYKISIVRQFARLLKAMSAKYGRFSVPRREHVIESVEEQKASFGWSVCVAVNAKNSLGAYVGLRTYWFFFTQGRVTRVQDIESQPDVYIGRSINCADGP